MIDTKYFDNTWFLMTVFMEVNFRNAVAAMHYRLWEKEAHTLSITGKSSSSLQAMAKELYNRQHSLLNTRARCLGLQGVSAGLSWRKSPARNCLRNLLLSSLDDTLPGLDPQLELYLRGSSAYYGAGALTSADSLAAVDAAAGKLATAMRHAVTASLKRRHRLMASRACSFDDVSPG
jgi:hypothetical protein